MSGFIVWRKRVTAFIVNLQQPLPGTRLQSIANIITYIFACFALAILVPLRFFLELPIHFRHTTSDGFSTSALRDANGSYLESYNTYIRRSHASVTVVMLSAVALVAQFAFFGYSIFTIGRPTSVEAYTTSLTINPVYDISGSMTQPYIDDGFGNCTPDVASYSCDSASSTTLRAAGQLHNIADCSVSGYSDTSYAAEMKYDFSAIPINSTITGVQLTVNISTSTTSLIQIVRPTTSDISGVACESVYDDAHTTARTYQTDLLWSTSGSKTYSLGGFGVSDVQSALASTKILSIAIQGVLANRAAIFASTNGASNKPQLVITYTLPPQAPTGFLSGAVTTSSIVWSWTDNATAETRYDVHTAGHTSVTGCTNVAANATTCTETGLSANTQYTRHPNVTDAQGNTDGSGTSAYTAIEAVSSVSLSSATTASVTVNASSVSNLGNGQSAIYFEDTTSGQNSGWVTSTTWNESGLQPNSMYDIRAKSRNSAGAETAFSSTTTVYTQATSPSITSGRTLSTWYSSGAFTFTNGVPWGSGGVQYYAYVWDTLPTHTFVGDGSIWSDQVSHCPGSGCDTTSTTLSLTPSSDSANWYLHVQAYDQAEQPQSTSDIGPFYFDGTGPTAPASVRDGLSADESATSSTTTLSANWSASADSVSGLQKYQYAIGLFVGDTSIVSYTDNGTNTSVSRTNLNLITGQTYYFSVRGVDVAGNIGSVASSNGITVSSSTTVVEPTIVPTPQPEPTPSTVATPTITTITSGQQTADTTPTIGGTGPAGAGAFIVVDRKLVRTVPIASNGTFVVDLVTPLTLGDHLIAVRAKTGPGMVSDESAPIPFTVVAAGAISTLVSRSVTNVTQPTVSFTVQAPSTSTVSILLDGAIIKTLRSGTCSTVCTVSSSVRLPSGLSVGSHTLSLVTVTDSGQLSIPTTISTFAQRAPSSTSVSPIRFKQSVRYTVQSGDSLWSIAQKVYGDGSRWTEIQRANTTVHPSLVSQPGTLQIGWTLQLPPG